jgi:hypothetical protein
MWTPVQMSGFGYFSQTPVVDRCIKSSTQPYNLHRQTLALKILKHVSHKNCLSSIATLPTVFQTASGSNIINTRTVCQELHEMGFHCRAAAHKPKVTMRNAKHRLEWCKARHHWTLEQWKWVL